MANRQSKKELQYIIVFAFLFVNIVWMINVGILVTDALSDGKPSLLRFHLANEITGTYSVLLLLPGLVWFFNKYPIDIKTHLRNLIYHVAGVLVFGFCHTSLMVFSRKMIYLLVGWEAYDPGIIKYRYLMEFQKQLLIYIFVYGVVTLFKYVRENQERRIKTTQLEKQLTESELHALKMQLNPHFLFNTLNMISSTMYNDVRKADQMIANLSDVLRMTLNTGKTQITSLKGELKILNAYLNIMKARFEDRLEINFDIDDNTLDAHCPSLCLQPLIENSIKHSMDKTTKRTVIGLQAKISDSGRNLEITIKDNGPGVEGAVDDAFNRGMGLKTTRDRFINLFGTEHTFQLKNIDTGGLEISIIIPAQSR